MIEKLNGPKFAVAANASAYQVNIDAKLIFGTRYMQNDTDVLVISNICDLHLVICSLKFCCLSIEAIIILHVPGTKGIDLLTIYRYLQFPILPKAHDLTVAQSL
jgi:hypothetical protein